MGGFLLVLFIINFQYSIIHLYRRGQGVEPNNEKACSLYRMAAEHEEKPNAYAAYELGRMCRDGIGTEVDKAVSDAWYASGKLFLTDEKDTQSAYYALYWLEEAARQENTNA